MSSLPPVATTDDVQARILPRILTDAELTRAGVLLKDVSAKIRRYTRKSFIAITDDVIEIKAPDGIIKLPGRPIVSVSEVVALSGNESIIANIIVGWWTFDGIDEVDATDGGSALINLPEDWNDSNAFPGTYRVTYTHGYAEVPDEVVSVAANAVLGVLTAPTVAAGVVGETVGDYSYRMDRAGTGLAVALTDSDLEDLNDFRDTEGTIRLGR
jgi:hypothetical protein